MTPEEHLNFISTVLALGDGFNHYGDLWESIWWRTDAPEFAPVTFMIGCNDLFAWACADCERLTTPEDVAELIRAVGDVREAVGVPRGDLPRGKDHVSADFNPWWEAGGTGAQLWCCRKRGMRPQSPWFKDWTPAVLALFLAAGPERDKKDEG